MIFVHSKFPLILDCMLRIHSTTEHKFHPGMLQHQQLEKHPQAWAFLIKIFGCKWNKSCNENQLNDELIHHLVYYNNCSRNELILLNRLLFCIIYPFNPKYILNFFINKCSKHHHFVSFL